MHTHPYGYLHNAHSPCLDSDTTTAGSHGHMVDGGGGGGRVFPAHPYGGGGADDHP